MCCGNSLTTKVYNKIRFSMELIITNPWCSATSSRHIKWGACLFKKEESTSVLGNLLMLWVEPERFFTPTRPQTQSLIGWGRRKFPVLIQRELRGGWKECRDRGGRGTWSLEEGASFSDSWSPWKRALRAKAKRDRKCSLPAQGAPVTPRGAATWEKWIYRDRKRRDGSHTAVVSTPLGSRRGSWEAAVILLQFGACNVVCRSDYWYLASLNITSFLKLIITVWCFVIVVYFQCL